MNTVEGEFYEGTLWELGLISAEISQLIKFLAHQEINPSVIQAVKAQVLLHDRVIIDKLAWPSDPSGTFEQ